MALYAADIESLAKPVKKVGGKKRKAEEASVLQEETPAVTPEPPAKKPPTEKQLAARAKFAENRKKKLEETAAEKLRLEAEVAEKQKEIEAKEAAIAEKKKARAEKRKASKEIDTAVEEALTEEPKPKKVKRVLKRDESVPPVWFEKFVESAKLEESKIAADKKPAKVVKEEAKVAAQAQWSDGYTRDRVNQQVDNHMSKLYGMIFTRK